MSYKRATLTTSVIFWGQQSNQGANIRVTHKSLLESFYRTQVYLGSNLWVWNFNTFCRLNWCDSLPTDDVNWAIKGMWQCKWRHLVAKLLSNATSTSLYLEFSFLTEFKFFLAGEITQVPKINTRSVVSLAMFSIKTVHKCLIQLTSIDAEGGELLISQIWNGNISDNSTSTKGGTSNIEHVLFTLWSQNFSIMRTAS